VPNVHADPDKLKQFGKSLTASADKLDEVVRGLSQGLSNSGWNDSERQKFEESFQQIVKNLGQFTNKLREYGPQLQKKAAALEQYRTR
jgi:uncharacterized protein YukE